MAVDKGPISKLFDRQNLIIILDFGLGGLPELPRSDVAADEDVVEVRAVAKADEWLEFGSHKDRNWHDDWQDDQKDWAKSGHSSSQLLLVWLQKFVLSRTTMEHFSSYKELIKYGWLYH